MELAKEMRRVLERGRSSGLSLLAFSKREGLSYSKLQYWGRKFRSGDDSSGRAEPPVELTRVRVVPDVTPSNGASPPVLAVWLGNGIALEVPAGFDAVELERLVNVLSAC